MEGFLLSRAAYTRIVHEYPDFRRYIQTVARLRLEREAASSSRRSELEAAGESIRNPGRASIVLLEKLQAATSTADPVPAPRGSVTKQDKVAERLVHRLNERRGSRRTSSQSMSEMWRHRSASLEKSSLALETGRQNTSSSSVAAASPSVVAASADECPATSSTATLAEDAVAYVKAVRYGGGARWAIRPLLLTTFLGFSVPGKSHTPCARAQRTRCVARDVQYVTRYAFRTFYPRPCGI
eukprot:scaffold107549_cov66-Phaeocystis_antarctica.AAC.5